jgi:cytochrome P450
MTSSAPYWDPFDREIAADPYPAFRRLRAEAPLWYNERHDFDVLSLWDDVDSALKDWQTFSPAVPGVHAATGCGRGGGRSAFTDQLVGGPPWSWCSHAVIALMQY